VVFFWTWKLGPGSEDDPSAPYWSYSAGVQAGLIPKSLSDKNVTTNITEACYEFMDTGQWKC